MDYTKYVLKSEEELKDLLAEKDNFFVVACNKCFKEFETTQEPECRCLMDLAEAQGKHITGSVNIDFLCNKVQTPKKHRTSWSFPVDWACRRWLTWRRSPRLPQPIL